MLSIFRRPPNPTQPQTTGQVIHSAISRAFAPRLRDHANNVFIGDRAFALVTREQGWQAVRDSATFYRPEQNDCDDLARAADFAMKKRAAKGAFAGLPPAFGYLWTDDHAWNVWVDPFCNVWLSDSPNRVIPIEDFRANLVRFVII